MQLGTQEVLIIVVLFLILFVLTDRAANVLVKGGRKASKRSSPPIEDGQQSPKNQLDAAGDVHGSVVSVGDDNQLNVEITNLVVPSTFHEDPFIIFVSSAEGQTKERAAVNEALVLLHGIFRLSNPNDLIPSAQRSPEDVDHLLKASNDFLLFASPQVDPAQLYEQQQAVAMGVENRFTFAPAEAAAEAAQTLQIPPEAVTSYHSLEVLPRVIGLTLHRAVFRSHRSRHLTRADLSLLLALGEHLGAPQDWLAEIRARLVQIAPAHTEMQPTRIDETAQYPQPEPAEVNTQAQQQPPRKSAALARQAWEPELVRIPAGAFWMGSPETYQLGSGNEKSFHKVYLEEYWIGRYRVTVAQFAVFVKRSGYRTQAEEQKFDYTWRTPDGKGSSIQGKAQHPVTNVSWYDALAYCRWLTKVTGQAYCLPSEAEWEKVARGTDERTYPLVNQLDPARCNISEFGPHDISLMERYSSESGDNSYGCTDMSSNLWEWTRSLWGDPMGSKGNPYYPDETQCEDVLGGSDVFRVMRGGTWTVNGKGARCPFRGWDGPRSLIGIGFRVVVRPSSPLNSDSLAL